MPEDAEEADDRLSRRQRAFSVSLQRAHDLAQSTTRPIEGGALSRRPIYYAFAARDGEQAAATMRYHHAFTRETLAGSTANASPRVAEIARKGLIHPPGRGDDPFGTEE